MGDGKGRTEMDPEAVRMAVSGLEEVKGILGEIRKKLADAGDRLGAEWVGTAKSAYLLADAYTRGKLLRMQVQTGMLHGLIMQTCDDRCTLDLDVAQAASGCSVTQKGGK